MGLGSLVLELKGMLKHAPPRSSYASGRRTLSVEIFRDSDIPRCVVFKLEPFDDVNWAAIPATPIPSVEEEDWSDVMGKRREYYIQSHSSQKRHRIVVHMA